MLEELARQNAEQRELFDQMSETWRNESARNREETLAAIRETANEQVPYNVQGVSCLHLLPRRQLTANSISTNSANLSQTKFGCC